MRRGGTRSRRSIASWASVNRRVLSRASAARLAELLGEPQVGWAESAPGRGRQQGHDPEAPVAGEERDPKEGVNAERLQEGRGADVAHLGAVRRGRCQGRSASINAPASSAGTPAVTAVTVCPAVQLGELHVDDAPVGQLGHDELRDALEGGAVAEGHELAARVGEETLGELGPLALGDVGGDAAEHAGHDALAERELEREEGVRPVLHHHLFLELERLARVEHSPVVDRAMISACVAGKSSASVLPRSRWLGRPATVAHLGGWRADTGPRDP